MDGSLKKSALRPGQIVIITKQGCSQKGKRAVVLGRAKGVVAGVTGTIGNIVGAVGTIGKAASSAVIGSSSSGGGGAVVQVRLETGSAIGKVRSYHANELRAQLTQHTPKEIGSRLIRFGAIEPMCAASTELAHEDYGFSDHQDHFYMVHVGMRIKLQRHAQLTQDVLDLLECAAADIDNEDNEAVGGSDEDEEGKAQRHKRDALLLSSGTVQQQMEWVLVELVQMLYSNDHHVIPMACNTLARLCSSHKFKQLLVSIHRRSASLSSDKRTGHTRPLARLVYLSTDGGAPNMAVQNAVNRLIRRFCEHAGGVNVLVYHLNLEDLFVLLECPVTDIQCMALNAVAKRGTFSADVRHTELLCHGLGGMARQQDGGRRGRDMERKGEKPGRKH